MIPEMLNEKPFNSGEKKTGNKQCLQLCAFLMNVLFAHKLLFYCGFLTINIDRMRIVSIDL